MLKREDDVFLSKLYKLFSKGTNKEIFPYIRRDYLERMFLRREVIWETNGNNEPIGLVVYMQYTHGGGKQLGKRGDIQLCEIVIDPDYQNKGVGTYLFKRLENIAAFSGAKHIVLSVRKSNARARAFYEKHGMQVVGEKTWNEKGTPLEGLVYMKEL